MWCKMTMIFYTLNIHVPSPACLARFGFQDRIQCVHVFFRCQVALRWMGERVSQHVRCICFVDVKSTLLFRSGSSTILQSTLFFIYFLLLFCSVLTLSPQYIYVAREPSSKLNENIVAHRVRATKLEMKEKMSQSQFHSKLF